MSTTARLRADIDIRQDPVAGSEILDRFPTNCEVEILEDQGDWLKIKPTKLKKTISGYVPRRALIFPPAPQPPVFPEFDLGGRTVAAVPPSVKLSDFSAWMTDGGKPAWIDDADWSQLTQVQQTVIKDRMTAPVRTDQDGWEAWVAKVAANNRQDEALMDEWVVTVLGGREVYTIRDHYVYKGPVQNALYWGCAVKGQSMRWTGEVQTSVEDQTRREFYQVNFYRMSQPMTGWFRKDITQEYFYPTEANDPDIAANSQTVFDLAEPLLLFPQDPEIAAAIAAKMTGAQYINIKNATGKSMIHFCLCGEFCVAAMGGSDIIPLLKAWNTAVPKYGRVNAILGNPKEGTSVGDLRSLLPLANLPTGETYSSTPGTPQFIKDKLQAGKLAIAGCGINSAGKVKADGTIRHWVVLEDILPVGNNGWVRIYNPFQNREEVYDYNTFMTSAGTGMGLWIQVPED